MSSPESARAGQGWLSGTVAGIREFVRGVREEMQRVSWPTREELLGSALVVFVGVVLLATYISVLDFLLSKTVQVFLR